MENKKYASTVHKKGDMTLETLIGFILVILLFLVGYKFYDLLHNLIIGWLG